MIRIFSKNGQLLTKIAEWTATKTKLTTVYGESVLKKVSKKRAKKAKKDC